jgi:hypothetical protein
MRQCGTLALLQPSNVDFKPSKMLRLGAVHLCDVPAIQTVREKQLCA